MPVSPPPPPPSRRVTGNCLSGVGCGVPYDGLTHDDLAGGEVADGEGLSLIVSVDAEHDALGPAWRQLVLGFWAPRAVNVGRALVVTSNLSPRLVWTLHKIPPCRELREAGAVAEADWFGYSEAL